MTEIAQERGSRPERVAPRATCSRTYPMKRGFKPWTMTPSASSPASSIIRGPRPEMKSGMGPGRHPSLAPEAVSARPLWFASPGEQTPDDRDGVPHQAEWALRTHPELGREFEPAGPDPDERSPAGELVERRGGAGDQGRVTELHGGDTGPESDPSRALRHQGLRDVHVPQEVVIGQPDVGEARVLRERREFGEFRDRPVEPDRDPCSHRSPLRTVDPGCHAPLASTPSCRI